MSAKRWAQFISALAVFFCSINYAHATRQFCVSIRYSWQDAGVGEDYQTANPAGQWADRVWIVLKKDGTTYWSGYADSGATTYSCTPKLNAPTGSYVMWTTMAFKPRSGSYIFVRDTKTQADAGDWTWYSKDFGTLAQTSYQKMHTINVGYQYTTSWATTNVGAVVSRLGGSRDFGLRSGTLQIYADESVTGSFYDNDEQAVYVGYDSGYGDNYTSKFVVAHEIGHWVHHQLMGDYLNNYTDSANKAVCRCGYVGAGIDSHCLQSREFSGPAVGEGWSQFFATSVFNDPAGSTAWMAYYKKSLNFTNPNVNSPISPPRPISVIPSTRYRWLEKQGCDAADTGSEVDWMGFLYYLNNKTSNKYTFTELEGVFDEMCGGKCVQQVSDLPTWTNLSTAVQNVYPAGNKRDHFIDNGAAFGVDH